MKLRNLAFIMVILMIVSCNKSENSSENSNNEKTEETSNTENPSENLVQLSLADEGIPVALMLPQEVSISKGTGVTEMNGVTYKNLNLKGGDYKMNASMPEEDFDGTMEEILESQKRLSSFDKGFNIIQECDNGYLYEFENSKGKNYAFVYATIKDNRQIIFTSLPSRSKNYTQEQIEKMFEAAKTVK